MFVIASWLAKQKKGPVRAPKVGLKTYLPLRLLSSVSGGGATNRPSRGNALSAMLKLAPRISSCHSTMRGTRCGGPGRGNAARNESSPIREPCAEIVCRAVVRCSWLRARSWHEARHLRGHKHARHRLDCANHSDSAIGPEFVPALINTPYNPNVYRLHQAQECLDPSPDFAPSASRRMLRRTIASARRHLPWRRRVRRCSRYCPDAFPTLAGCDATHRHSDGRGKALVPTTKRRGQRTGQGSMRVRFPALLHRAAPSAVSNSHTQNAQERSCG